MKNINYKVIAPFLFVHVFFVSLYSRDNKPVDEASCVQFIDFSNQVTEDVNIQEPDNNAIEDDAAEHEDSLMHMPDLINFPVHYTVATGNLEAIEQIIANTPEYDFTERDDQGFTPMHYAAHYGHADIIQRLHQVNSNLIAMQGGFLQATPLAYAVRFCRAEAVRVLLDLGANPYEHTINADVESDARSMTILALAAPYDHGEMVQIFIDHGYEFHEDDNTLHAAASFLNVDLVNYLIGHGARIDQRNPFTNWLPVFYVVAPNSSVVDNLAPDELLFRQQELVDLLGNNNALTAQTGSSRRSVMHLVAQFNNAVLAAYLFGLNPDLINIRTAGNDSPLHYAAYYGQVGMVEFLVDHAHMFVDDANNDGMTALHYAIQEGADAVVIALIGRNASITIRDNAGVTPFDQAMLYDSEHDIASDSEDSMAALVLREYKRLHHDNNMEAVFQLAFDVLQRTGGLSWLPVLIKMQQCYHSTKSL